MTNISAVSAPKNQSVGSRANTVPSPNDIEDAIEKFGRLRLVRDHKVHGKRSIVVDRVDEGTIRDRTVIERGEERRTKFGECVVSSGRPSIDTHGHDREQDQDRDNLIERGPIKSQYFSPTRNQPYWTTVDNQSRGIEANDTFLIDYDKTAEQILGDKEYGEKLNACLDQLQGLDKTYWSPYGDEKSENVPLGSDTARDQIPLTSTTIESDSADDLLLLESVLCGAFQAAQHATESSFLPSPETSESYPTDSLVGDRNPVTSRSESRESSRAQSPAAVVPMESSRTTQPSFGQSTVGSPPVTAPSSYRPSQILPYSSSSSSSSSNHSFGGDTPSPNGSSRTAFESRIAGRFLEDLDNFPFWSENREILATDNTAVGNIDNSDLWSKVVEELVNGLEGERAKVGLTCKESTVYPKEFQRSVSRNWTMDDRAKARVADHSEEGVPITQLSLPWSTSAMYSTQRDGEMTKTKTKTKTKTTTTTRTTLISTATTTTTTKTTTTTTNTRLTGYAINANFPSTYQKSNDERPSRNVEPDFSALFHSFDNASPSPDITSLCSDDFETKKSTTHTRDDFDIPKMVACFETRTRRRCNSDRCIIPWPSLNLPSVKASDRLKEKLSPKQVEKAMISLLKRPVEELAEQDRDGDTTLMCLVGNPDELVRKMAYLVPLVERLSAIPAALTVTNDRGEDALYLAALNCPQFPYVAGYLAAAMVEKGIDVGQLYYHTRGDTLIHSIAAQGDSHVETLAELLALRTVQGNAMFDLSKRNYDGKTALHVAIESHDPLTRGITSVATVKLLLKYGADPRIKETKCGDTALHMTLALGCDPALVKVLLNASAYDLVNAINYNHDTALHVAAAASNTVSLERLREVCWLLIHAGAHANSLNRQGKAPLALVSSERKDAVRKIFYKRS